jgi:hypothetical protein
MNRILIKGNNENTKLLNNKDECIICMKDLKKDDESLIITNEFCYCYNSAKICMECLKEIIRQRRCIICRKIIQDIDKKVEDIYEIDCIKRIKDELTSIEIENINATNTYEDSGNESLRDIYRESFQSCLIIVMPFIIILILIYICMNLK